MAITRWCGARTTHHANGTSGHGIARTRPPRVVAFGRRRLLEASTRTEDLVHHSFPRSRPSSLVARVIPAIAIAAMLLLPAARAGVAAPAKPTLRLIEVLADSVAYDVNATLIAGPTEAVLVDAQFRASDARRLADQIAATGTHLKAIFITHPDEDHYLGAAVIEERFPGTPVYMTPAAIEEFKQKAPEYLAGIKAHAPQEAPDSLVTPQPLPSTTLTVDGAKIEVIPDQQGDVLKPTNSFLWIPSLRAVIAGDIVFNGVHAWLGASSPEARVAWHQSIARIAALHPLIVVAGHKSSADLPDSPDVLRRMDQYLTDFDAARAASPDAKGLAAAMTEKYPSYPERQLLGYSAQMAYKQ
jgi:glyoxylase-like metal-dependent hydrolase (beta-lactamase superfamily II)